MAVVKKVLVLIGGMDADKKITTNQVNSWDKDLQRWVSTLPPMKIARQDCAAVSVDKKWLLVAGGSYFKKPMDSVELLNVSTNQWIMADPLPKPSIGMSACIIKNTCYLLGGTNFIDATKGGETGPKEYVFSLELDGNVATNKWERLLDTPLYCSAPVAFGEYLMVVGGTNSLTSRTYNSCMFLYSPSTEKWVFVGNMPSQRSAVTCVVLSPERLVVMGGQESKSKYSRKVEILHC